MMNSIREILLIQLLIVGMGAFAQVGVMTNNPDESAQLDVASQDKGLLIPRIVLSGDLSSPLPVSNPAEGLLVFNTGANQDQGLYYWSGTQWLLIETPHGDTLRGPNQSTDEAIVRFDGNSGKVVQNSIVTIDDGANIANLNTITTTNFKLTANPGKEKILVSDHSGNGSWQVTPGLTITQGENTTIHDVNTLSFDGGSTVQDRGNDVARVSFYKNAVTRDLIQLTSFDTISLNSFDSLTPMPWDTEIEKNAATFIHSNKSNNSRIYVRISGIYEINYIVDCISRTIQRKTLRMRVRKNGSEIFSFSACYSFSYNMEDFQNAHNSSSFLMQLEAGDYIEMVTNGQTNPGPLLMIPGQNVFFMRLLQPL